MKASGVFMYKGITQRDGGTFKNDKGEDVSYNSCMVLTCDEIQEDGTGMETKVYNKKKESNLNIQGELTRVEITRELDDFCISDVKLLNYDNNFPSLYLNKYIYSFEDYKDRTLFALLYAVQNGFPIQDLSRRYREKIKNLFEGGYKIRFNNSLATDVLRKTIFYYFMKNPKVRWK